jgi:hypothetical protein
MSSPLVSRRSVSRGAAWSVPLVVVGVAAPAFAASSGAPPADLSKSCKCAGNGPNNYDFKTVLSFNGTTGTFTVVVNSWSFDGVAQPTPSPNSLTLTNGKGDLVLHTNKTNSASKHDATVTYTITDTVTGIATTASVSIVQQMYPPNCPGIGC